MYIEVLVRSHCVTILNYLAKKILNIWAFNRGCNINKFQLDKASQAKLIAEAWINTPSPNALDQLNETISASLLQFLQSTPPAHSIPPRSPLNPPSTPVRPPRVPCFACFFVTILTSSFSFALAPASFYLYLLTLLLALHLTYHSFSQSNLRYLGYANIWTFVPISLC